jgi:hypothetical protein
MLRAAIDRIIEFGPSSIAFVLAHVGALVWAWWARRLGPVLALNLVFAVGTLLYNLPVLPQVLAEMDARLALVAFAVVSLAGLVAAVARWRFAKWIVWIAFTVDFVLCTSLLVFLLTFKITRLI